MMSWRLWKEAKRRRKRYEPIRQESPDEPFGSLPEEYLYRCLVCCEELLVHKAIIDGAMSTAKFHREYEYTGGIPTLVCPGPWCDLEGRRAHSDSLLRTAAARDILLDSREENAYARGVCR
jgi:hypothetical protein